METTLIKCLVCNNEFSNVMKLAKHLKYVHHTNLEQYFSRYIQIRPNCVICEKPVTFKSYDIGFSECCDSRKCSAINFRKKLKANTNKYNSFVNKVSTNMINTADTLRKTWDIRGDEILAKMMDTHLKNNKPNSYIFSKDDYNKMDTLLSKLFDL